MTRRRLVFLLKLALAAGLIAFLVVRQQIPFERFGHLVKGWPWLAGAQVPFAAVLLLAAARWRLLLRAQGIHYGFRDALELTLIGFFFNQVLLGATGGDVVKAYYVAVEQPSRRAAGVLTVFLDRALGLAVLCGVAGAGIFANLDLVAARPELLSVAAFLGALFLGGGGLLVLLYSERVRRHPGLRRLLSRLPLRNLLRSLEAAIYVYKDHKRDVALACVLSVFLHLGVIAANYFFLLSLGESPPSAWALLLLVPLAQIVMAIPITPASWGTAEAAYDALFRIVGLSSGALVSLLQRLTYYVFAAIGCVFYLRRRIRIPPGGGEEDTGSDRGRNRESGPLETDAGGAAGGPRGTGSAAS